MHYSRLIELDHLKSIAVSKAKLDLSALFVEADGPSESSWV